LLIALLQGVPPWHTAEEMRQFSNAAHTIEGLIIACASAVLLAQASGRLTSRSCARAAPYLMLLAGAFLVLFLMLPVHGLSTANLHWSFVLGDAQQRQHLIMGVLLLLLGWADVSRGESGGWLALVCPVVIATIGALFLSHEQHGTSDAVARAVLIHRGLGVLFLLAGALCLHARLRPRVQWAAQAWPIFLLLASLLLLFYREPAGAYHHATPQSPTTPGWRPSPAAVPGVSAFLWLDRPRAGENSSTPAQVRDRAHAAR
jgi:hypothetical protein